MEPPTSHAFKRMKKEKVIEYAIKMRDNLEGELSVALAERDQADEAKPAVPLSRQPQLCQCLVPSQRVARTHNPHPIS